LTRSLKEATFRTAACVLYGFTIKEIDNFNVMCYQNR
jgi:hypothetical protein